jgi:CHAT domain-containing protein
VFLYQQAVRDKERKDEAKLSTALHQLYKQIWEPLEAQFPPDTKTVIISPDASLNFISFATLLTPRDQFLAEKYSVRYVASGRDLLREPVKSSSQEMVVFAAPDYIAGGQINPAQTGLQLLPLPYFAKNAAELATQAKGWNWPVRVYLGAEATETQVRDIHSPRILHFSTHGFFLPDTIKGPDRFSFLGYSLDSKETQTQVILKNPMYRSGVALAGAQVTLDAWQRGEIPPTDTDGILTAEEVGSLNLHGTWLVVLSACDTGIGEPRFGEGVMCLRRGFVQAGAQNLLMTLWPVFDVPSGELMVNFYSRLHQDNNPPQALAEVQRDWLIKLRAKTGLLPAVVMAGAFIVSSQGPVQ